MTEQLERKNKSLSNVLHSNRCIVFFFLVLVTEVLVLLIGYWYGLSCPQINFSFPLKKYYISLRGREMFKAARTSFMWVILNNVGGYVDAACQI